MERGIMENLVLRENMGGRCTLTLNRPNKMNALSLDVFRELRAHVDELEKQFDSIGCVVLRGSGRCFSAGHDLNQIESGEAKTTRSFQAETIEHLANLPQTVIVALHGYCFTGALELALAGDMLIADESALFADTHGKWALTPIWGMSQRLPRRVGEAKAKEIMLTCRTYNAQEALAMGLVNWCVPTDQFEAEIDRLTKTILENSWFSNRANKRLIERTSGMSLSEGLQFEIENTEGYGPDKEERIAAFTKKK